MKNVSIINTNGFCVSRTELTDDEGNLLTYELKKGESIVEKIRDATLIYPKWNGSQWIEGATEEEIKAWNEENKIIKQPTTEEKMLKQIADLKIDNMKKNTIINNTLKTVAELKVKVMSMEGGN